MIINLLSLATLISAIIAVYSRHTERQKLFAVFKPLTTILIIAISIIIFQKEQSSYSAIVSIALVFCLIGDIFLLKDSYFLSGLSAFLLAHIVFTIAFTKISGFNWNLPVITILLIVGGVYFRFLRKYLADYLIPVAIYMSTILVMNWQAIGLAISHNSGAFAGIAIASLLFSFSDAVIAYNKFVKPFKSAEILILSTYWVAIYVLAFGGLYLAE